MAGTVLGPDQVRKLNAVFPALVAHVKELLSSEHTGYGLMKVHMMVESFDSDEMSRIFRELSFISPREKLALVRAAIYELIVTNSQLFITPQLQIFPAVEALKTSGYIQAEEPKAFNPPQFNLNVNKTTAFHGERSADTPAPAPVVTSTHTPKVAAMVQEGAKQEAAQTEKLSAAVAKLRAVNTPVELPAAPEDAALPQVEE